jgi:hypothetical protein
MPGWLLPGQQIDLVQKFPQLNRELITNDPKGGQKPTLMSELECQLEREPIAMLGKLVSQLINQPKAQHELEWQKGSNVGMIIVMKFDTKVAFENVYSGRTVKGGA